MTPRCFEEKNILNRLNKGFSIDPRETEKLKNHIAACSRCRDQAVAQGLSGLLRIFRSDPVPEPSPSFYVRLSRNIEEMDPPKEYGLLSDLFLSASLKLVPVMAALLLMLSATFARYYQSPPGEISYSSVEDITLFSDSEINTDTFLQKILTIEAQNGK